MIFCGFCGLEVHQLCFCHRESFQTGLSRTRDKLENHIYRSVYYSQIIETLHLPDEKYLLREPAFRVYREAWHNLRLARFF